MDIFNANRYGAGMTQDALLYMRVSEDVKRTLDRLRKMEADLPSKSEMVRRLIERADEKARQEAKRK